MCILFGFPVQRVTTACLAVFFYLKAVLHRSFVFRRRIITVLALRTCEYNDISHKNHLIVNNGAHDQDRTGDLILTKDVLYRLSYVGLLNPEKLNLFILNADYKASVCSG
jgi:hypothetical protein